MMGKWRALFWFCVCLVASLHSAESADKRVALVIGNGDYDAIGDLANPANDARGMAALLADRLGFEVVSAVDANHAQMLAKLGEFGAAATNADIALVFYAGHGVQVAGRNYLLPTSANVRSEIDLATQTIRLDDVMEVVDLSGATTKILLIDACRNNPLPANLARGARKIGLAPTVTSTIGLLIAYATGPDQLALDGTGGNSPFTEGLLANLGSSGIELRQALLRVKNFVFEATAKKQTPWVVDSLLAEVFLGGRETALPAGDGAPAVMLYAPSPDRQACESLGDRPSPIMLEAYLDRYPDGYCAAAVKRRLERLVDKPASPPAKGPEEPETFVVEENHPGDAGPASGAYQISSYWDHNGSVVALSASGNNRVFYYEQPRSRLVERGVRPGTLLFKGSIQGNRYVGEAYVFNRQCGPFSYPVKGEVSGDRRQVVVYGRAPRRDDRSCEIVGWRSDRLVFSYKSKSL